MEDNSFVYFTQDDVLKNIDIDPRLVESFKRVMTRLQKYFNEKGYTKDRDYREYLEKYLLKSNDKSISIQVEDNMQPGVGGYYYKLKCKIRINEEKLKCAEEELDITLCHEFIHFLVMHELRYGEAEKAIINGGFINEALTQLLAEEVIPNSNSNAYDAQVAMHKYANIISGNKNNFRMFLLGKIDARYRSSAWNNYMKCADSFQKDFDEAGYINLKEAQNNRNFIEAQRYIVSLYMNSNTITSIEEYMDWITKLINRPVSDNDYINNYVNKIDDILLRKLQVRDKDLIVVLKQQLVRIRELLKQKNTDGYYLEFAGRKFSISENLDIKLLDVGKNVIQYSKNPSTGTIKIMCNNQTIELNKKDLLFNKEIIDKQLQDISKYFTKEYIENYSKIKSAVEQNGNLLKIEKFTLPNIDFNNKRRIVYVATYNNKIVVLNNTNIIKEIENIPLNKYKGLTSKNNNTAAIYQEQIGNIDGVVYTYLSNKQLYNLAIINYSKIVESLISEDELNEVIDKYKNSDLYDLNETKEETRINAIDYLSRENFEKINDYERNEYIEKAKQENDKFIVTMNNGNVEVGLMHGNSAFIATKEVLYDSNTKSNYDDIVNGLKECNLEKKNIPSLDISLGVIKKQHSTMINKIESLLGIEITNYFELKDKYTLTNEQREINKRLTQLYYEGKINYKDYIEMKQAILIEYSNMVKNAPEPVIEQEYVQENEHSMSM